jgi:FkbM family methyltransferase
VAADLARVCVLHRDLTGLARLRFAASDPAVVVALHPRSLGGTPVLVRAGTPDFRTFLSTFAARYHSAPVEVGPVDRILDLGANVGYTAIDLAARFPRSTVIAVEMDPDNFAGAVENTAAFGDRVRCVNAAVWVHDHGVSYPCDVDSDAFAVGQDGTSSATARDVESVTIDQLVDMLPGKHADFVKLDVEGAESVLLQPENASWLGRVGSLNVEVHDATLLSAMSEQLRRAGFHVRRSTSHWSALEAWRTPGTDD